MSIQTTPALAIERLKEQRSAIKAYDSRLIQQHKSAVKKVAADRRVILKAYLALSDQELAEKSSYTMRDEIAHSNVDVACPLSRVAMLEAQLVELALDQRKTITVSADNQLFQLLTFDPTAPPSRLC
jgi:hypothetical protein